MQNIRQIESTVMYKYKYCILKVHWYNRNGFRLFYAKQPHKHINKYMHME